MSKVRVGIVGTGGIARVHVRELQRLSDEVDVVAAIDLTEDRTVWVTEATGAQYFESVADALPHIDAAYVTTPPRARIETIRTLAEGGKAIFCEKPLAGTVEDALAIEKIVQTHDVPFMMGFMRRWHAPYSELKRLVSSDELGRPLQISRKRHGFLDIPAGNWRVTGSQLTGFTIESVSHDIDLLRWLGGDVTHASGEVIESRGDLPGYDDMMVATLRFENGAIGQLQIAWSALVTENSVGVYGTDAAAVIDGADMWRSDRLRGGNRSTQNTELEQFGDGVADEDGYVGQTRAFVALARGEAVDHPGVADGVATVRISHQILDSSHGR